MRKYLLMLFGSLIMIICWAKPDFIYRYWFDENSTNMIEGSSVDNNLKFEADVSSLTENMHILHLQIIDSDNTPGAVVSHFFVKILPNNSEYLRYWFDNDCNSAQIIPAKFSIIDIDVSQLSEGMHILNVQTAGVEPSPVRSSMFIKTPQRMDTDYLTCVTYVDGIVYKSDKVNPNGDVVHYDMPIADLSAGLHTLSVQLVTPSGSASDIKKCYFLRHPTGNELSHMSCFYAIDDFSDMAQAKSFDNGSFCFDVDVSSITDGLHTITYMLTLDNGTVSDIKSGIFYKIPLGGYGLSHYLYWINDREDAITRVDVEGLPEDLQLTELLPVETQPFRSSLFHFEIDKSGQAWAYAANEFHFRIYSNDLHSTEMSKTYIDYSVSQRIDNAQLLSSGIPVVKEKPDENEIQWYHFTASLGDSLSFKVNRACTVQVFAPSGKEIYTASGSQIVEWNGCHAMEDGEYYLALHDVTAQNGDNTQLEYQHIDKYAVLDYTPKEIGLTHCVLVSDLIGNGLDKLVSARLTRDNIEINMDTIVSQSISQAKLLLELKDLDIPLGKYDLNLTFNGEKGQDNLSITDFVEIEEAVYGKIDTKVITNNTSKVPYPISVSISNTGNVPYQLIPVNIANTGGDIVTDITFNNFALNIDYDEVSDTNAAGYLTNRVFSNETTGYCLPLILDNLNPYEEVILELGYNAPRNHSFDFYAWAQAPWLNISRSNDESISDDDDGRFSGCNLLDVADDIPSFNPIDWANRLSDLSQALGMLFGGIVNTSRTQVNRAVLDAYGITPDLIGDELYNDIYESRPLYGRVYSPQEIIETSLGQGGLYAPKLLPAEANKRSTECEYVPKIQINIPGPVDPNDIIGYTAESGSCYVKKDLLSLNYKIEFENDTAFATSSAHVVVIKDTLDVKIFDLSSFKPTSIMIGEKMIELDGNPNFIKTIDMRPAINTIAQVECTVENQSGIVTWTFTSLDPMTMEPTYGIMSGFLPINFNGRGQGEVSFDINLKPNLPDGTDIVNSASIVFDKEDAIMTPVWLNIIDSVEPTSHIKSIDKIDKSIATIHIEGDDERSGVWYYNIYAQYGQDAPWEPIIEKVDTTDVNINILEGIDYGFCVLAVDSAGNVENKELYREASLGNYLQGDANSDGTVDIQDAVLIIQYYIEAPETYLNASAADFNKDGIIDIQDAVGIVNMYVTTDSNKQYIRKRINLKR